MSSAQLGSRLQPLDELAGQFPAQFPEHDETSTSPEQFGLKQQVAARLAEHRARRQRNTGPVPVNAPIPIASPERAAHRAAAARISAAVAERYASSQSYRSFFNAQSESAIREAEAAAEIAARNARAVAAAQLDLLDELNQYAELNQFAEQNLYAEPNHNATNQPQTEHSKPSEPASRPRVSPSQKAQSHTETAPPSPDLDLFPTSTAISSNNHPQSNTLDQQPATNHHLTVRLYEPSVTLSQQQAINNKRPETIDPLDAEEHLALDEEIAFRQAPTFEESLPITEIPANLIEFPRQLIAARRARPRLAEGPLREDGAPSEELSQLRIFEVEPEQISSAPAMASAAPQWTSIMLDAQPYSAPDAPLHYTEADAAQLYVPFDAPLQPLQTAPLELRIMAAAVDTCIILATLLAFTAAATLTIGPLPLLNLQPFSLAHPFTWLAQLLPSALIAGGGFLALTALYQILFFTFSDATPGMYYARIGLCTFSDENPTRAQMRRRALAFLVSACPLGLGLLWSWIDTDRLGWHDRLSRMYQRSY